MVLAKLSLDGNWIFLTSDNMMEMGNIRMYFTKKINNWYILKKTHPNMVLDESFINDYNMIPIGLWMELVEVCKKHGYNLQFADDFAERTTDASLTREKFDKFIDKLFGNSSITPRDYQLDSAFYSLFYKRCCIEVSTSGGKTIIAYILFRYMKDVLGLKHILYITPKTELTIQSSDKFIKYDKANGIESDWTYAEIHAKAKKKKEYDQDIVFGNYQSLKSKKADFFEKFDAVINDETHHAGCSSIIGIFKKCKSVPYKIGMTGTFPEKDSYNSFNIQSIVGALVYRYTSHQLIYDAKSATPVHVYSFILNYLPNDKRQALYNLRKLRNTENPDEGKMILDLEKDQVHESYERTKYICDLISKTTKNSLIIFSDIKNEYGKNIYQRLKENTDKNVYYIDGHTDTNRRQEIKDAMEDDTDGNTIIVSSIGCFSEGIDICNLWNIFLIETTKSENSIAQLLGRGMRMFKGKEKTMFIDFVDDFRTGNTSYSENYLYKHGLKRMEEYRKRGFPHKIVEVNIR